jgi:hypothetical protein
MAITFHFYCSYQNELEYEVHGHPFIKRIEAYSECRFGLLEHQRKDFNGDADEFERIMVARQGGVLIRHVDKPYRDTPSYWEDHRWSQELYSAFVKWLDDEHAKYLVDHEQRRARSGYTEEEFPATEMRPIPRPMFFNPESKRYEVEPWFHSEPQSAESTALLCII